MKLILLSFIGLVVSIKLREGPIANASSQEEQQCLALNGSLCGSKMIKCCQKQKCNKGVRPFFEEFCPSQFVINYPSEEV